MKEETKTPEQKLKDAAEFIIDATSLGKFEDDYPKLYSAIRLSCIEAMFQFAKSKAAKEYWSQSQSSEIERLKEENEKLSEKLNDCVNSDCVALIIEIEKLKTQLEAKAVDVEGLRKEFYRTANSNSAPFHNKFANIEFNKVFDFFLPHLHSGKSDAVVPKDNDYRIELEE